jgi:hypothetical protein
VLADKLAILIIITENHSAEESEAAAALIILTIIALPFVVLYYILKAVLRHSLGGAIYQVSGHILLKIYGAHGYDYSLWNSVYLGAVGGAIIAVPWSLLTTLVEKCVEPPRPASTSEEDGTQPLLSSEQGTGHNGTTNNSSTERNRFSFGSSIFKFSFAVIALMLFAPAFGAASGAVGSSVLTRFGKPAISVRAAAGVGTLGGLVPFIFMGFFLLFALVISVGVVASSS